jgi:biotin carboxyl carrier protein
VLAELAIGVPAPQAASDVLMIEGRAVRLWNPAMAASAAAATHGARAAGGDVVAPMQGTVVKVLVDAGAAVEAGDPLVVLEAMKMETAISAPRAGTVAVLSVSPGDTAAAGQVIASIE